MKLGYVSVAGRGRIDLLLADVVERLKASRLAIAGTVQTNIERDDRPKCDMDLRLLPDGSVFSERSMSKVRSRERGWRYAVDQLVAAGAEPPSGDLRTWLPLALRQATRPLQHSGNLRYLFGLTRSVARKLPASLPYVKMERRTT